jgi:hypothetical protein
MLPAPTLLTLTPQTLTPTDTAHPSPQPEYHLLLPLIQR